MHRRILSFVTLIALTACGGDSTGPSETSGPSGNGSFTATITGAESATPQGTANFATLDGQRFLLTLQSGVTGGISLTRLQGGIPGTGTYALKALSESGPADLTGSYLTAGGKIYIAQTKSAAVTITSSSATRIRGSFTFQGVISGGGAAVTVTGTFDAVGR